MRPGVHQLLHFSHEARLAPVRASWRIRQHQSLPRRVAMTGLIALLHLPAARRAVVTYTLGGRLRRDLDVLGTGNEQITCQWRDASRSHTVLKIVIATVGCPPDVLEEELTRYRGDAAEIAAVLGSYDVTPSYRIEAVDRRGRRHAVVGEQSRVAIIESVFDVGGELSERARQLPAEVRSELVERLRNLAESGRFIDVVGIGNLVFVEGCDWPVVIDNIPMRPWALEMPSDDMDGTLRDEVYVRLASLSA
jgi:hypothetical protein